MNGVYRSFNILLLCVFAMGMQSCATTQMAQSSLNAKYSGRNVDSFFIKNGPPYGDYRLSDGGHMYSWTSGVRSIMMPGSSSCTGTAIAGYANINCTDYPSSSMNLRCDLQILTNQKKIIKSIRIQKDTLGVWEISRCNEILSRK